MFFFHWRWLFCFSETLTLNDPDWAFNHGVRIIVIRSLILISNMTTFHSDWNLTFFDLFSDIFDLWLLFCDPEKHFLEKLRSKTSFLYDSYIISKSEVWPSLSYLTSGDLQITFLEKPWKKRHFDLSPVMLSIRIKISQF